MNTLVACGDSFFFGSDLSDCDSDRQIHSNFTWPALLSNSLDLEYKCLAEGGVGNLRILQQIIRAVKVYGNSAIYLVNWSWIDRFDYIGITDFGKDGWITARPSSTDDLSQSYFKNFHSQEKDQFQTLVYIDYAYHLLTDTKCKFVMTYMDPLTVDTRYHSDRYLGLLQQKAISKLESFDGMTFLEWSRHKGFRESDGWHPLEEAHQAAAGYWLSRI